VVVVARRHVIFAIDSRFLIETLTGTIVQASLGPDRIAAAKAYDSHPIPLLGIKLVDPAISLDVPISWRPREIAAGRHFDGPATDAPTLLVVGTRGVSVIDRTD
jgi:hypothetical protein